eukprot:gb/GEZN01000146.1/.p1 GENE.gb/GEZN01000146.1/~~gb/GEZN01000146.1/.p1  ORF type:complete len:2016 (+),score=362.69 gb/GEZN01000146.1/:289-6336(+)
MQAADTTADIRPPSGTEDDNQALVMDLSAASGATTLHPAPASSLPIVLKEDRYGCRKSSLFFTQLQALLYKNWLLKTRGWVTLTSEILLPVIAMLLLILVKVVSKTQQVVMDMPYPLAINRIQNFDPVTGFVPGASQFQRGLHRQGLRPNCSQPFTLVDSAYCNYHLALAPTNSTAIQRLVTILQNFDNVWYHSLEMYDNAEEMYSYIKGKNYPDKKNGKAYLFFAVVVNKDGPDFEYTIMANITNSSAKSSELNADPPRLPNPKAYPDEFQKKNDEYLKYTRGFIQMQYLIDNFLVLNSGMPAWQVVDYWLNFIESDASSPPVYNVSQPSSSPSISRSPFSSLSNPSSPSPFSSASLSPTPNSDNISNHNSTPGHNNSNNSGNIGMGGAGLITTPIGKAAAVSVYPPVPRPYTAVFPSPEYSFNAFLGTIGPWYGIIYVAALIWPVTRICKIVVEEKEERIVQGFLMMGTKYAAIWLSWLMTYALIFLIIATIIVIAAGKQLFPQSNLVILFLLLYLMGLATFAFSFAYCSLFDNSRLAQTVIGLLFFFTGLLNSTLQDPKIRALTGVRVVFSLMPTSALVQGMDMMANIEMYGIGVTFDNWGMRYKNDWSVKLSATMLFFDFLLYMALGIYFNNVVPQEFGVALPWYYCCLPSYWKDLFGMTKKKTAALLNLSKGSRLVGEVNAPAQYKRLSLSVGDERKVEAADNGSRVSSPSSSPAKRKVSNDSDSGTGERQVNIQQVDADHSSQATDSYPYKPAVVEEMSVEQKSRTAIRIRNLRKTYNEGDEDQEVQALRGLDLDLVQGEILVLLGHNGAGKTTALSVLSGLFPPTSGDAEIFGRSVTREMSDIRQALGVCPQDNILYPILTVKEHLSMYAKLKGVKPGDVDKAVTDMIAQIGLTEKVNAKAGTLSGGMKRKLSVGMAFIGDSKVVLLDEPTSGMDPYSRRATWDLLKNARKDRVIVLTTHFMDEADYLGDRIAIMGKGRLICCGTALFLKKHYGVGYNMTITRLGQGQVTRDSNRASRKLAQLVQHFVPTASILSDSANEIAYRLPLKASGRFADMFDAIDVDRKTLGVNHYGISVTTLEEVFLRVGQDEEALNMEEMIKMKDQDMRRVHTAKLRSTKDSFRLKASDFESPSPVKKLSSADVPSPDSKQELVDVEGGLQDIAVDQSDPFEGAAEEDKTTDASDRASETSETDRPVIPRMDSMMMFTPKLFQKGDIELFKTQVRAMWIKRYQHAKRDRRTLVCEIVIPAIIFFTGACVGSIQTLKNQPVVHLDPFGVYHKLPEVISYNTWDYDSSGNKLPPYASDFFSNSTSWLLPDSELEKTYKSDVKSLSKFLLENYNMPQERYSAYAFNYNSSATNPALNSYDIPLSWQPSTGDLLTLAVMFNTTTVHSLPVALNQLANIRLRNINSTLKIRTNQQAFPLTVDQNQKKFAPTSSFYISLAFTWVASAYGSIVVMERQTNSKHQQMISGVGPIAYWASHLAFDMSHFLIPLVLSLIIAGIFRVWPLLVNADVFVLAMIWYNMAVCLWSYLLSFLFTQSNATEATLRIVFVVTGPILAVVNILLMTVEATAEIQKRVVFLFRIFPTFCFSDSMANLYIHGNSRGQGWDMNVTGWNFVFMSLQIVVFGVSVLTIEHIHSTAALNNWMKGTVSIPEEKKKKQEELDTDIVAEAKRVNEDPAALKDVVRITHLRQVFPGRLGAPPKVAVEDLSFGVAAGECFGFLGINGAGKTTTMEMLTGKLTPTSGTAFLSGYNIKTQQEEIRRQLGYCPQFDALIGNLTARETLYLYARLKGLHEDDIPAYVDKLLAKLQLLPISDQPCKGYSGGDKRRLSVGVALLGNPKILFLDEPSTGMDPSSRRFMWELIATTMHGRSVILTTHSMEEAEALCSRIGIMVGGRLRCLGSPQHLKHRYGDGYQIDMNVIPHNVPLIDQWIKELAPTAALLEKHGGSIKYRLPRECTLAKMFRLVEKEKQRLGILEYSLAETSLEQIFIHFAKQQEEEKGHVAGLT